MRNGGLVEKGSHSLAGMRTLTARGPIWRGNETQKNLLRTGKSRGNFAVAMIKEGGGLYQKSILEGRHQTGVASCRATDGKQIQQGLRF